MLAFVLIIVGLVLAFAATAAASPDAGVILAPDPESANFFGDLYNAIANHNWRYAAAALIIFLVYLTRTTFKNRIEALVKGKWAWTLAIGMGGLGGVVTYLLSSMPLSVGGIFGALLNGLFVGSSATGLYKGFREWQQNK